MAEQDLPPQSRKMALYAAGGGFAGALLATLLIWLLWKPCCCERPTVAAPAVSSVGQAATGTLHRPG